MNGDEHEALRRLRQDLSALRTDIGAKLDALERRLDALETARDAKAPSSAAAATAPQDRPDNTVHAGVADQTPTRRREPPKMEA